MNGVPLGLSASVCTARASRSHDIAARLDFGTVCVNSHFVLACEVPLGGFKESGYARTSPGRRLREGVDQLMPLRRPSVAIS